MDTASPCSICPKPGTCCQRLQLNTQFPEQLSRAQVADLVEEEGLPFLPLYSLDEAFEGDPSDTRRWTFSCLNLGPSGLCTAYEDRPNLCRTYQPADNGLCVWGGAGGRGARQPEVARARVPVGSAGLGPDVASLEWPPYQGKNYPLKPCGRPRVRVACCLHKTEDERWHSRRWKRGSIGGREIRAVCCNCGRSQWGSLGWKPEKNQSQHGDHLPKGVGVGAAT